MQQQEQQKQSNNSNSNNNIKHHRIINKNSNKSGMRREILDPKIIHSHRIINYGENHPYDEKKKKQQQQAQRVLNGRSRSSYDESLVEEDDMSYKPIRIYFETSSLDEWARDAQNDNIKKIDYLKSIVLPETKHIWSDVLHIVPVVDTVTIQHSWCPYGNKNAAIFNEGINNFDLIVFVTANSKTCDGGGTLASAFSCSWDQYQRPIAGNIDFCLDTMDLDELGDGQDLGGGLFNRAIGTATHEFGHILGVSSNDFVFFYDWSTGLPRTPNPIKQEITCVNGSKANVYLPNTNTLRVGGVKNNLPYYEIVTPTVRNVVQNQFNCTKVHGARLENQRTYGDCFGSHWDERYYFTELMSSVQTDVTEYLSPLTLGLLYDSGWYKPNFKKAQISPFGLNAGCDFLFNDCILDGGILPKSSQGFFCKDEFIPGDDDGYTYGCDPTHLKMAICDLIDFSNHPSGEGAAPPPDFQYFDNPLLGSIMQTADYCPTYSAEAIPCLNFPEKEYPSIFYNNNNQEITTTATNNSIAEDYSIHARCIDLKDSVRPACFHTICDDENYTVIIVTSDDADSDNNVIICEYDGQTHLLPNTDTTMYCPRLSVLCPQFTCPVNCAGKGKCDSTRTPPTCVCFDPDDTSPGCTNSINIVPPKLSSNENNASSIHSTSFTHILLFIHIINIIRSFI